MAQAAAGWQARVRAAEGWAERARRAEEGWAEAERREAVAEEAVAALRAEGVRVAAQLADTQAAMQAATAQLRLLQQKVKSAQARCPARLKQQAAMLRCRSGYFAYRSVIHCRSLAEL